jgi:hypothetical protein
MKKVSLTVPLLCMCLVALPLSMAQIPDYQPLAKLNYDKIVDTMWYQLFWADNDDTWNQTACCIYWFHRVCPTNPTTIWSLNAYNNLTPQGKLNRGGSTGKINPQAQGELRISLYDDAYDAYYTLEHADDYSWIIRANTYISGGFIEVLSKTNTKSTNEYVISRGLELAAQYNLEVIHWLTHNKKCDYKGMLSSIKSIV